MDKVAASPSTTQKLGELAGELPDLNALIGLANLRSVLGIWTTHAQNSDEDFWQDVFGQHAFVLSQVFCYPIVLIREKAYVGGKRLDNAHGKLVDFLGQVPGSGEAVLIEIKTPTTQLLGREYRQDIFPPSHDLSGALAQVLSYRESLMHELHSLNADAGDRLLGVEPRCVVIAGCGKDELNDEARRRSFERFRERLQSVTLLTFDELFDRIGGLGRLIGEESGSAS